MARSPDFPDSPRARTALKLTDNALPDPTTHLILPTRPATRAGFDAQRGPNGALLIGSSDEVAEKILRHDEALGGSSRISFQMNAASLPHGKLMRAIEAIGARVAPALRKEGSGKGLNV